MIRPGEGIPQTREQAQALLAAVHYDLSELCPDQIRAVRDLYGLDSYLTLAETKKEAPREAPGKVFYAKRGGL